MAQRFRMSFSAAEKVRALVGARRVRNNLRPETVLRGENVRSNGSVYIDVLAESREPLEMLAELAGPGIQVNIELAPLVDTVDECLGCGNISDAPYVRCPNCGFVEISNCPSCHQEIPRSAYVGTGPNVFSCPNCAAAVRLVFNEPLWREDGHYSQPVVVVVPA